MFVVGNAVRVSTSTAVMPRAAPASAALAAVTLAVLAALVGEFKFRIININHKSNLNFPPNE